MIKDLMKLQKSPISIEENECKEVEMPKALEKLDEFYETYVEENTRKTGVHHPSEISGTMCPRKYVLTEMYPEEKDNKISPHLRKIFGVGHALHDFMQEQYALSGMMYGRYACSRKCEDCPYKGEYFGFKPGKEVCPKGIAEWKYSEVTIDNREYNIHGHTDGILVINGKKYIYEFKTINDRGYRALNVPLQNHIEQTLLYLYCESKSSKQRLTKVQEKLKTEKDMPYWKRKYFEEQEEVEKLDYSGIIIQYMSKDRQTIKEYFVENDTERLEEFIKEKGMYLKYADKCLEERILPEKICRNKTEGKTKHYCRVADKCFE